ncbi:MAG TPA: hypothetical protein VKT77_11450 [Chthonomonadaceae bacterium]|nr:hypothetical protein [Chthonomonadaceae bacterium]
MKLLLALTALVCLEAFIAAPSATAQRASLVIRTRTHHHRHHVRRYHRHYRHRTGASLHVRL